MVTEQKDMFNLDPKFAKARELGLTFTWDARKVFTSEIACKKTNCTNTILAKA